MKIVGIEGVQEFLDDGNLGVRNNMIVELKTGEQFRVPIGIDTYTMLTELGNMVALQTGSQPGVLPAKQRLGRTVEPGQVPQSLEDFSKTFITGPNAGAPPVPPQMAETQQDLVGQLSTLSSDEALELAGDHGQTDDPLSLLRKVGFLGEPEDVLSAMNTKTETYGSDVIESFEDTSDVDYDDPGEEYDDDDDMAEQF